MDTLERCGAGSGGSRQVLGASVVVANPPPSLPDLSVFQSVTRSASAGCVGCFVCV